LSNLTDELRADLAAEYQDLELTLDAVPGDQWTAVTPAAGWAIVDQLAHLVWSEVAAAQAAGDPEGFVRWRDSLDGDFEPAVKAGLAEGRVLPTGELRARWRAASQGLLAAIAAMDPGSRIPWFGPSMSAVSMMSARLMETWAHGQDIADTVKLERTPTGRLRHIAHLGFATRGWSYRVRDLEPPEAAVHVALRGPDGDLWAWGPGDAADRVVGAALDFCLVVTQRRHVRDTSLTVEGEFAHEWMLIAQAFAGAPGPGRAPGSVG
jgi:uncharacterized protein (TIGR03084 family)